MSRRTLAQRLRAVKDLDDLFREAEPHLVGVWKFRERGHAPLWCATVIVNGELFDIDGTPTIKATLKQALRTIDRETPSP